MPEEPQPTAVDIDERHFQSGRHRIAEFIRDHLAPGVTVSSNRVCCDHHRELFLIGVADGLIGYAAHLATICGSDPVSLMQTLIDAVAAGEPVRQGIHKTREAMEEAGVANVAPDQPGRH